MQLLSLDMLMEQAMYQIFPLTHIAKIVGVLQMGNQAFWFLLTVIGCFKLKDTSRKFISFQVEFIYHILKSSLCQLILTQMILQ